MKTQFLKQLPLFADLNKTNLDAIAKNLEKKTYLKDEIIFREGQQADKLFMIFDGLVKIFKLTSDGKEYILHIASKNSIIAEAPMFEGGKYPANCVAMRDTTFFTIPRQKLIFLIKKEPQIALNILALQAKRLREFTSKIEQLSFKNTKQKFLNFLQQNAHSENGITIVDTKNLNIQELANYLGTARENLSRIINELIKNGVIKKCGGGFCVRP